ncbi:IclR family transcriptional regulator [Nocardia sp. alder85J]|uniref:IclR family transcriptional regulator n=1 Tax=Nocardia sp. alder85J TaxID=2862949 RepID=UPI001CD54CFE|nr:IclR family transcriptional regulator [Nocardia sp. alder85J]MCX4092382.1 IclR family transcriptional regulator [Nocardia sp. alder85J]
MPRTATGESSLTRAIRILTAFTPEEPALPVTEIARRTGLPNATASRLIAELAAHGLLERRPDRLISIGMRLWELAARASPAVSLRDAAMPFLEDVHTVVGHHAQLGVLDGTDVLFLERLSARDAVINYSRVAGRLPLHISSSGHILLAHGGDALRQRILNGPLPARTARTVVDPAELAAVLADTQRLGYTLLRGHVHEDAAGVAVPVRNGMHEVVAALSVIVPNDARAESYVPVLLAAARGISRRIAENRSDSRMR